jgi:hypothetical protein
MSPLSSVANKIEDFLSHIPSKLALPICSAMRQALANRRDAADVAVQTAASST